MGKRWTVAVTAAALVALGGGGPRQVAAQQTTIPVPGVQPAGLVELIQNGVASLSEVAVFTVPEDRFLLITDMVLSNDNAIAACCQRIFRELTAATSLITVGATSSFGHTFSSAILFSAGERVIVRNGGSSGPTNFYLRGYFVVPQ